MSSERIIVKIDRQGKIAISVDGVKGPSCTDLTKSLEKALGKTVSTVPTGEMYEQEVKEEGHVQLGGGSY